MAWITEKCCENLWTGFIWLSMGPMAGSYGHGNKLFGAIKGSKFFE